jgi:hypothetical protein
MSTPPKYSQKMLSIPRIQSACPLLGRSRTVVIHSATRSELKVVSDPSVRVEPKDDGSTELERAVNDERDLTGWLDSTDREPAEDDFSSNSDDEAMVV